MPTWFGCPACEALRGGWEQKFLSSPPGVLHQVPAVGLALSAKPFPPAQVSYVVLVAVLET